MSRSGSLRSNAGLGIGALWHVVGICCLCCTGLLKDTLLLVGLSERKYGAVFLVFDLVSGP